MPQTKPKPKPSKQAAKPKKPAAKPTKPTKSAKRPAKSKPAAPSASSAPTDLTPSEITHTIQLLRARSAPLSPTLRRAFDRRSTAAQRSEKGKATKAVDVLKGATRWAIDIDAELRERPAALRGYYSPEKLAYYLEHLEALDKKAAADQKKADAREQKRGSADSARQQVLGEREDLIHRLEDIAGQRSAMRTALRAASGTTDGDNLQRSVVALVELARKWMEHADEEETLLFQQNAIDAELLAGIEKKAGALTGVAVDASFAGRAKANDSPEVNREEGAVLYAMIDAMTGFEAAKKRNDLVRRLVPPQKIAHALGVHPYRASTNADDSGATPAPAAGATKAPAATPEPTPA